MSNNDGYKFDAEDLKNLCKDLRRETLQVCFGNDAFFSQDEAVKLAAAKACKRSSEIFKRVCSRNFNPPLPED